MDKFCEDCIHNEVCQYYAIPPHKDRCNDKDTIDDLIPQGEWITRHKLNSFGQDVVCFECNKCGEYKVPLYHLLITEPLKVCPNCGADMRKGGAE